MAQAPREILQTLVEGFNKLGNGRKIGLIVGVAGLIAVLVVLSFFIGAPQYRVLFANVSEKDGGAIIAQLSQMNIPYRIAEGGGAILVPSDVVYKTRLTLASQGLPKGGGVGFELMEGQKFGASQFQEQVNFQRALEGELARTIRSLQEVQDARVHLAVPRPTVFVRENQKPSASVLVTVYPGRILEPVQVAGIVHLIASSVPELSPRQVTVVDQGGNLLSGPGEDTGVTGLDRAQLKYLRSVEDGISRKIEAILKPMTGPDNVRAQVAATLDFSEVEQTSETYRPNSDPKDQAIRSQQVAESNSQTPQPPQGVPGALSNTPPGAASAPLVAGNAANQGNGPPPMATSTQKDTKTNFEVDKTIRHTKGEVGGVKRLSVAVLVNHKKVIDGETAKLVPFDEKEMAQITNLVREAMGFDKDRGDSLNVVNAAFRIGDDEQVAFWKNPANIPYAIEGAKWLLVGTLALAFLLVIRSGVRDIVKLGQPPEPATAGAGADGGTGTVPGEGGTAGGGEGGGVAGAEASAAEVTSAEETEYERNLRLMRELARDNPRLVAQIIKNWVSNDE
jgi:flagellar M-ring protein FliF